MRCKVGDLVVIVAADASYAYLIGKFCHITGWTDEYGGQWVLDARHHCGLPWSSFDRDLRPIRPDEGTDETLLWVPKETVNA